MRRTKKLNHAEYPVRTNYNRELFIKRLVNEDELYLEHESRNEIPPYNPKKFEVKNKIGMWNFIRQLRP